jgi:hypothetical protein
MSRKQLHSVAIVPFRARKPAQQPITNTYTFEKASAGRGCICGSSR